MAKKEMTVSKYIGAFVALVILSALTFGLSFFSLGPFEWPLALGIAAMKGIIVALFFMHLIEMSPTHQISAVVAIALLAILILFSMADVWTRPFEVGPKVPSEATRARNQVSVACT